MSAANRPSIRLTLRFSLVQLLGASMCTAPAALLIAIGVEDGSTGALVGGAIVGALALLLLATAWSGVDLYPDTREIARWSGPRRPLFVRRTPLPEGDRVVLETRTDTRRLPNQRRDVTTTAHHVYLRGAAVTAVTTADDRVTARGIAERVAKALGSGLVVIEEGVERFIERELLDEPLRARLRRDGAPAMPEPMAGVTSTVRREGERFIIDIPKGSAPFAFGRWWPILLAAAAAVYFVVEPDPKRRFIALLAVGASLLYDLLTFLWLPREVPRARAATVEIAPDAVTVRLGGLWPRVERLDTSRIEELGEVVVGRERAPALRARCDDHEVTFALFMPPAELVWLKQALEHAIASGDKEGTQPRAIAS